MLQFYKYFTCSLLFKNLSSASNKICNRQKLAGHNADYLTVKNIYLIKTLKNKRFF